MGLHQHPSTPSETVSGSAGGVSPAERDCAGEFLVRLVLTVGGTATDLPSYLQKRHVFHGDLPLQILTSL